ncbi:MAG: hypothetical protein ABIP48_22500, partial [Planctomycetota bacterium]
MLSARLLIPLLVAATVLVDLVVLSVLLYDEGFPRDWPHPVVAVFCSLAMAQVSLVALWTGFGGKSLPWRVMGLVVAIVLWSVLTAPTLNPTEIEESQSIWTIFLLAQAAGVLIPLSIARMMGVKLVRASAVDVTGQAASGQGRLQFSLGYLMSWITVVAVAMGLLHYTVGYPFLPWLGELWWMLLVVDIAHSALALAALWGALGTRRPTLRAIVLALTTGAVIFVGYKLAHVDDLLPYAALCLLQLLWLVASLCVVRVAGYRVVRRVRAGAEEAPVPEEVG